MRSNSKEIDWRRRLPFFYGWLVLASAVIILAIIYGVYYSFSVFYVALLQETGWSRGETAAVFSVFVLVTAFAGIPGGALIDQLGPSRVVPLGGLTLALGLFLCGRVATLWEYGIYFGIMCGVALALAGWVPQLVIVSGWFSEKRGLAMGIASAGVGLGIVVFVPVSQYLISTVGWRAAYQLHAVLTLLIVVPIGLLVQVGHPRELGLKPDGAPTAAGNANRVKRRQVRLLDQKWASFPWSLSTALRTSRLWLLLGTMTLGVLTNQMLWVHQAAYLVDGGYDGMLAASTVGLAGFVSIFAKTFWGTISDRTGREWALTLGSIAMLCGILLLTLTRVVVSPWTVFLFAAVFATGYASIAPMVSTSTADLFAGKNFGAIYGFVCIGQGVGGALGAWVAGYVFDLTGSYHTAFVLAAASFLCSVLCLWLAAPRSVRRVME